MVLLQLYILRNWEEYRLPFKMKDNKANYLFKKKNIPDQDVLLGQFDEDGELIMPEWSKYLNRYK